MLFSFLLLAAVPRTARASAKPAKGPRTVTLLSPGSPLVSLRVLFEVGAVDDPKGKEGLAALTSAMVGEGGTKSRSYAEVIDALYPLAAGIGVYGDKETAVFAGTVHRDNLDKYVDLLVEQITAPRFAEDDFSRHKQDAIDAIEKTLRGNDDEDLGKEALGVLMYGKHPYGRPSMGTVQGLKAITLDDVKAFYAKYYAADRLLLGVAGGTSQEFADAFAKRFAGLPGKSPARAKLPPPPRRKGRQALIVEKEARANAISMGVPIDTTRRDADFAALVVGASYLGEHRTFNGVLMNRLRGVRGLNYGDYAYVENFIQEGGSTFPLPNITRRQQHFEIWLRPVPPANTGFAIRAALYETEKLLEQGIPAEGFEATRKFLSGYVSLWTQDAARRLGYAMDAVIYGRDLQKELRDKLPKMTKADVDKALRKHIKLDGLSIAIVSDKAADLAAKLGSGEPTPITYDTQGTPQDVLAEDAIIEKYPHRLSKTTVKVVPAGDMFER